MRVFLIFLVLPLLAYAQDVSDPKNLQGQTTTMPGVTNSSGAACPAGTRQITTSDAQRLAALGVRTNSRCIGQQEEQLIATNPEELYAFFKTRTCSGNFGLPSDFNQNNTDPSNWATIKDAGTGHVYFSANGAAMNPGSLKCFKQLFEQAEAQGLQPCITAALRSPAHQRASCFDGQNSTVCGRGRGSGPQGCPADLGGYMSCPHVNGYSMDLNEKTEFGSIRGGGGPKLTKVLNMARSMSFSKVGVNGAADPWHVEAAQCAIGGTIQNTPGNDSWSGTYSRPASQRTGGTIANTLRSLLQPFTQDQQSQTTPTQQLPTQSIISPFTLPQTTSATQTTASSAADILLASLKHTGTSTSFPLTSNTTTIGGTTVSNPVTIVVSGQNTVQDVTPTTQQAPAIVSAPQNFPDVRTPTTFTSERFSGNVQPFAFTQENTDTALKRSRLLQILENLKQVLLRLLSVLRPFGGQPARVQ